MGNFLSCVPVDPGIVGVFMGNHRTDAPGGFRSRLSPRRCGSPRIAIITQKAFGDLQKEKRTILSQRAPAPMGRGGVKGAVQFKKKISPEHKNRENRVHRKSTGFPAIHPDAALHFLEPDRSKPYLHRSCGPVPAVVCVPSRAGPACGEGETDSRIEVSGKNGPVKKVLGPSSSLSPGWSWHGSLTR